MKTTLVAQFTIPQMIYVPTLRLINSCDRSDLAPIEQQAVYLMTEGWSDLEIARELELEESTLKGILVGICNKIGVCDSVELLFYILSGGRERMTPDETSQDETPKSSESVRSYDLRLRT